MKNEQSNQNQSGSTGNQANKNQQQTGMKQGGEQTGKTGSQTSAEKSNISVDNEGKIGKAHDQWNNSNNNRNEQDQNRQNQSAGNQQRPQTKSDKSANEPEIDSPIYDPEKTDKKLPRMEEQTKSNK